MTQAQQTTQTDESNAMLNTTFGSTNNFMRKAAGAGLAFLSLGLAVVAFSTMYASIPGTIPSYDTTGLPENPIDWSSLLHHLNNGYDRETSAGCIILSVACAFAAMSKFEKEPQQ